MQVLGTLAAAEEAGCERYASPESKHFTSSLALQYVRNIMIDECFQSHCLIHKGF
jgi:hypothetical protein